MRRVDFSIVLEDHEERSVMHEVYHKLRFIAMEYRGTKVTASEDGKVLAESGDRARIKTGGEPAVSLETLTKGPK